MDKVENVIVYRNIINVCAHAKLAISCLKDISVYIQYEEAVDASASIV